MIGHPRRRRRVEKPDKSVDANSLSLKEQVCEELRDIQWRTNCSTKTIQCLLDSLRGKLGKLIRECDSLPQNVTFADKKMRQMVGCCRQNA